MVCCIEQHIGWRLDYVLPSRALAEKAVSCEVLRAFGTSDHAPVLALFDVEPPRSDREPSDVEVEPTSQGARGQLPLF